MRQQRLATHRSPFDSERHGQNSAMDSIVADGTEHRCADGDDDDLDDRSERDLARPDRRARTNTAAPHTTATSTRIHSP